MWAPPVLLAVLRCMWTNLLPDRRDRKLEFIRSTTRSSFVFLRITQQDVFVSFSHLDMFQHYYSSVFFRSVTRCCVMCLISWCYSGVIIPLCQEGHAHCSQVAPSGRSGNMYATAWPGKRPQSSVQKQAGSWRWWQKGSGRCRTVLRELIRHIKADRLGQESNRRSVPTWDVLSNDL